jgi:hypothetical protein
MHWESIVLLAVIALGGIAVIGGYVVGFRGKAGAADAMWGGVPAKIRPVYGVSMILSAASFLAVLYYLFLEHAPGELTAGDLYGLRLIPIFFMILAPSALWLPLSKLYLKKPGPARWFSVRVVLFIVGLASIALAWALFDSNVQPHSVAYRLATVAGCYFAFHTFVLDALLWAALFRRSRPGSQS